ncbi:HD-GYP domain-containing protein [Fimbriimonas ginsengisoli]|uniref:Metal dependent phosphohydrolase n=1 Tax=Fimbriimonas ginsengisoli Gsoil 348 TaxID=661478 RepID=A0A068NWK5_FIMGI|nr:HD domain-containing phosphohydrolase [Fimbriimonas ginsengisoli]AIE87831.1 metal dependent phosphohydrolase [Fimbriimonas ginsengisoli Gsoil 348]
MTQQEKNAVVRSLVDEMAARDPAERGHSDRVAVYAVATGERLGLTDARLLNLRYAAALHDIGRALGSPDMKQYPFEGFERLGQIAFLRPAAKIVLFHRERMDGSGYPAGLAGEQISMESRIVGACEAFDELLFGGGGADLRSGAFDQRVVDALMEVQRVIQPVGSR